MKQKKTYFQPLFEVSELSVGTPLAISGDTNNYENLPGQDNVTYEIRNGGWGCENWMEEGVHVLVAVAQFLDFVLVVADAATHLPLPVFQG